MARYKQKARILAGDPPMKQSRKSARIMKTLATTAITKRKRITQTPQNVPSVQLQTSSPGERSLSLLLSSLRVSLHPSTFVFTTFPPDTQPSPTLFQQMSFRESEGLTVITTLESAKEHPNLAFTFTCRMIVCEIHSSLEAVGFMHALSGALTAKGIGANSVSAYHHDYLFVALGRENEAFGVLQDLAGKHAKE